MGTIRDVLKVKPICAVTFQPRIELSQIVRALQSILGSVEDQSTIFDFSFSDYYREEMGTGLKKVFMSFQNSIHPSELPGKKLETNALEDRWSVKSERRVNLDPGYITGAKLVLASTKNFSHRIYLEDGIYGDLQLRFRQNRFHPNEWTYPDYQTELAFSFFRKVREKYIQQGQSEKVN